MFLKQLISALDLLNDNKKVFADHTVCLAGAFCIEVILKVHL